jgi:hypothetical protein
MLARNDRCGQFKPADFAVLHPGYDFLGLDGPPKNHVLSIEVQAPNHLAMSLCALAPLRDNLRN